MGQAAMELGTAVRDARRKAGLTQAELGEFLGGVDRHVIAAIERGRVTAQVQRILDLFEAVGLELELRPRTVGHAARGVHAADRQ